MYRLMIADDEEIERRAFRLFVNKNFSDLIVLEDAVNGIELVEKVMRQNPDIVIVDINMPGLNGLDAIKVLKQKGLSAKIIIHTAYSHFEYAQEALQLGADDYILKPVKREKIIATLSECISKITNERKKEDDHKRLEKMISEISPIIETDFMSSILLGDIHIENLRIYTDILGINFTAGYIMTLSLPDHELSVIKNNEVEKNALKKEILGLVRDELNNVCNCIISPVISNKISIFISTETEMSQYRFKVWSIELAELLAEKVEKFYGIKINVGIGQLYNDLEQLTKSYRESINVLSDKSVNSHVKHFGDIFSETKFINPFISYEGDILKYIAACDFEACKGVIGQIFDDTEESTEVDTLKDMVLGFAVTLTRAFSENNMLPGHGFYSIKYAFKEVMNLNSMQELKLWVENTIESMIHLLKKERNAKINNFVKSGVDYINENYARDISLENVAEKIGVSPYYLSRLFKQELNKNFIDYLTDVRVKHALRLLKEKDYPIKELSEMVGYNNLTYFCKVFKKVTGKTVGEYRDEKDY